MKFQVIEQKLYLKAHKKLSKQYRYLQNDIDNFLNSIKSKEDLGIELKSNIFKVRVKNSDKIKVKVLAIGL
jgi:hypothetical protein